jgi:hypothetical protein
VRTWERALRAVVSWLGCAWYFSLVAWADGTSCWWGVGGDIPYAGPSDIARIPIWGLRNAVTDKLSRSRREIRRTRSAGGSIKLPDQSNQRRRTRV